MTGWQLLSPVSTALRAHPTELPASGCSVELVDRPAVCTAEQACLPVEHQACAEALPPQQSPWPTPGLRPGCPGSWF